MSDNIQHGLYLNVPLDSEEKILASYLDERLKSPFSPKSHLRSSTFLINFYTLCQISSNMDYS